MPDFRVLLSRLTKWLDERELPFMIIGGQAVLLHGEPRLTQDIDVTLGLAPDRLAEVLSVCADIGLDPLPDDVEDFVRTTYVLPAAEPQTGIRVDFIFSTTAYEATAISQAQRVVVGDASVPFATAEDLILHKLFAGRPRDMEDAAGVVRRKGPELDWDYLHRWALEFAKVEGREGLPDAIDRLRAEM
jgi:hypothetical protein